MVERQRLLLAFIEERGGRALSQGKLTNWLFLLLQEQAPAPDASGFHDFVPRSGLGNRGCCTGRGVLVGDPRDP